MGSSRLPGKVLLPLAGRPVLGWVVRAARVARRVGTVVVATTTDRADDPIDEWCRAEDVAVVRGSEADVVARFAQAVATHPGDPVVRLTADCPLLDPEVVDGVVDLYRDSGADFVATDLVMHLPRGTDVEAMSPAALSWVDEHATGVDRVHVTSSIYRNPYLFTLVPYQRDHEAGHYRATLDTTEDLEALRAIVAELGDRPPSVDELIALLDRRPDIVAMNAHVEQKPIAEG